MQQDIIFPIIRILSIIVIILTLPINQGFPYNTEPLIDHKLFAELELILFYPNLFVTRKQGVINGAPINPQ